MTRVSHGFTRHKRHRAFISAAKGFRLGRKNVYKQVRLALIKQGTNAYRGRKEKKRTFRALWIERLNASLRTKGSKYSVFIGQMQKKDSLWLPPDMNLQHEQIIQQGKLSKDYVNRIVARKEKKPKWLQRLDYGFNLWEPFKFNYTY